MSWHEHCRVNPFYDCYQCQVRGLSYTDRVLHLWGLFSYLTFIIILVKICIQSKIISKYCLVIASIVGCLKSSVGMMHMWLPLWSTCPIVTCRCMSDPNAWFMIATTLVSNPFLSEGYVEGSVNLFLFWHYSAEPVKCILTQWKSWQLLLLTFLDLSQKAWSRALVLSPYVIQL